MKVSVRLVGLLGLTALFASGTAGADNFGLRVKPGGIDKLVEIAPAALPKTFALDPLGGTVIDCPIIDDMTASFATQSLNLNWRYFDLEILDDAVAVKAVLDIQGAGQLDLENTVCIFGNSTCDVGLQASALNVSADLPLFSTPNGIEVGEVDVRVHVYSENFNLDSDGCLVGDALETVVEWFEDYALGKLTEKIESRAEEAIPALVASKLSSSMPLHIEKAGFHIDALLSALGLSEAMGLTVGGQATVTWMGGDGTLPSFPAAEGEALPGDFPGDFAIAAADDLIGSALYEAWRGGVFDAKLSELAPTITLSEDGLAQKLGLPGGTELGVSLNLGKAPLVDFGRSSQGIHIALTELNVGIDITPPSGPAGHVDVKVIASIDAGFAVDSVRGALNLAINDLRVNELEINAGQGQLLRADPERLAIFISDVGAPMLAQKLAGLPLSPALKPSEELDAYIYLLELQAAGGWLRAGADLYTPDPNDALPPNTAADVPAVVPAGMAVIPVMGFDDGTPRGLMRFAIQIDGADVHPEPQLMSAARLSMAEGEHSVSIAAVDMNGNIDPKPVEARVIVDGTPPQLAVTDGPPVVLPNGMVDLSWTASDDRTNVGVRCTLSDYGKKHDVGTIITEGSGASTDSLHLEGFKKSSLYVLRVIAEDEAGNVTSEEFGFALEQGGCSAAGSATSTWLILAMLALFALVSRRRRHLAVGAAVALAWVASGSVAMAQGTSFSGPTDADGASAYWNPAAMSAGKGTRFDAGSGVAAVRINYVPEDRAEGSSTFIPKPSPSVGGYTDAITPKLRAGFTVGVPSVAGAEWDRDDPAGDVTRYYAAKAKNYYLSTTLAASYQVADWIALGGGASVVYGRLDAAFDKDMGAQLNRALGSSQASPFPLGHPDLAAPVELESSGVGVGGVAGILLTPSRYVTIGSSLHTPVGITAKGDINVSYPERMVNFVAAAAPAAQLPDLNGTTEVGIDLPMALYSAIAVHPTSSLEIRLDHRFVNYSAASTVDVAITEASSPDLADTNIIRGSRDVHSAGLRVVHGFAGGRARAAVLGRYERSKIPERTTTPSNMDFDKYEIGGAIQYRLSQHFGLIVEYCHFELKTQTVDESLFRAVLDPALDALNKPGPEGTYSGRADNFGLFLSAFY